LVRKEGNCKYWRWWVRWPPVKLGDPNISPDYSWSMPYQTGAWRTASPLQAFSQLRLGNKFYCLLMDRRTGSCTYNRSAQHLQANLPHQTYASIWFIPHPNQALESGAVTIILDKGVWKVVEHLHSCLEENIVYYQCRPSRDARNQHRNWKQVIAKILPEGNSDSIYASATWGICAILIEQQE